MSENRRVLSEPAYILHQRAYSETSLLLDIFSRNYGRMTLIAKGVKQKKSRTRGILLPFKSLIIAWSGRGEVKTMINAEALGYTKMIQGERLFCGYYVNELILRMLHRADPHERLFDAYQGALDGLAHDRDLERTLRIFEKHLLQQLGYGFRLSTDTYTGDSIEPAIKYRYLPEIGPVRDNGKRLGGVVVHGASLIALQAEEKFSDLNRRELKQLSRATLDHHLGGKPLHSRDLFSSLLIKDAEKGMYLKNCNSNGN